MQQQDECSGNVEAPWICTNAGVKKVQRAALPQNIDSHGHVPSKQKHSVCYAEGQEKAQSFMSVPRMTFVT